MTDDRFLSLLSNDFAGFTDIYSRLKNAEKPVVLYGTGNGADKIIDEFEKRNIPVSGIFASDGFVRKRNFRGFEVKSYDEICDEFGDFIVIVAFGSSREEVIENIIKIKSEHELFSIDVPVCGTEIFDVSYCSLHKKELEKVYSVLSDELSRLVFKNVILFKLTGDIDYLFSCETKKEDDLKLLKFSSEETYADFGAYNGDTIREFVSSVKSYRKIYAVEPDKGSFKKLISNTQDLKNIEAINCAVGKTEGNTFFSASKGRGSAQSDSGKEIMLRTPDSILNESNVTVIKFDVEGSEEDAVCGSAETIKKCKPKMIISCYHRRSDIFSLPLKVLSICGEYNIYLRRNKYIPAWDTQYYFV